VGSEFGRFETAAFEGSGIWRSVRVREAPRLLRLLQRIREITRSLSKAGEPDWTTMKFTLHREGRFHVEFGYEPLE
jgi:hypothetical protein